MLKVALAVLAVSLATPAAAGDKIGIAPAGSWVKAPAAAKVDPAPESGPPLRSLRIDQQVRFSADATDIYLEQADEVRSAIGLQHLGTVTIGWDPAHEDISIHKLNILRGGQTIDVLAKQSFRITHAELNIGEEVDGTLMASLHPEDLRVGDIMEFAYTRTRSDPVMNGHADEVIQLTGRAERQTFRAIYPDDLPVQVRAGRGLQPPKSTRRGSMTELTLDRTKAQAPKYTPGAPARYAPRQELEFSSFRSWAEVSTMMAPLFEAASQIGPDSPLRAEIAKIRASSDDPKVRAGAALKLVEDNVRYLALVLSDGGYTPVAADKTWARRFGDCKAKTALLVGLLRELEIKAEPALVNAEGSPDLDTRLPRMSAFNHVIVRAEIAGKTYWLDATRSGDQSLDALETPDHDFALPLRAGGGGLISLASVPRDRPDTERRLTIDVRDGLEAAAPVHGELVMRGDAALWPSLLTTNMSVTDRDKLLKLMWPQSWIEVKSVSATRDAESGESRMSMDGVAKLVWYVSPSGPVYLVPGATVGQRYLPKREADTEADLPFVVPGYPDYALYNLTIVLPEKGQGYSVAAPDVDKIVGGVSYVRHSKIADGKVTIETRTRTLQPEISAAEAKATTTELADMAAQRVMIQGPRFYQPTPADVVAWLAREPATVAQFAERGWRLAGAGRLKEAMADLDQAVARDPSFAGAYATRGLVHLRMGKTALGKADLDKASSLGVRNAGVQTSLGLMALSEGRFDDAVTAFSRAMDMSPNNIYALRMRAGAYRAMGQTDKTLADLDELAEMDPKAFEAQAMKAEVYASVGQLQKALDAADAGLVVSPKEPILLNLRAGLLSQLDRREEALKAFDASLAIRPMSVTYLMRANYRPKTDLAGRLADIGAAERVEHDNLAVVGMRARALLDNGKGAPALAVLDAAVKARPDQSRYLLQERARVRMKLGQTAGAIEDLRSLRSLVGETASGLNDLCWTQATLGLALQSALADCEASLKLQPKFAATLDSKGFVLLRLGRVEESVSAYDEAVSLRPYQAQSLYGRGLAKLKLGRSAEGNADLKAARTYSKGVDEEFAGYGLTPGA
jgi:tetratricopeptide (TPR) repeat protein